MVTKKSPVKPRRLTYHQMAERLSALGTVEIRFRHHRLTPHTSPWLCTISRVSIGGDGTLLGPCGNGTSPYEALADLYNQLTGLGARKYIVLNAQTGTRLQLRWNGHM